MRLATTAAIAVLALSSAALAQVAGSRPGQMGHNMTMNTMSGPGDASTPTPMNDTTDTTGTTDNMMSNSAAPPPSEPR